MDEVVQQYPPPQANAEAEKLKPAKGNERHKPYSLPSFPLLRFVSFDVIALDKSSARVYSASVNKIIALLALALLTASAHATEDVLPNSWLAIVKTEDGHMLFLDTSDIVRTENGTVKFWLTALKDNVLYEQGQYEIDCSRNLITFHSRIFLERTVDKTDAEVTSPKRITVKPSTSIEIITNRVCERLFRLQGPPAEGNEFARARARADKYTEPVPLRTGLTNSP